MITNIDDAQDPAAQGAPTEKLWRTRLLPLGVTAGMLVLAIVVPARSGPSGSGASSAALPLFTPEVVTLQAATTPPVAQPSAPSLGLPDVFAPPLVELAGGGFPAPTTTENAPRTFERPTAVPPVQTPNITPATGARPPLSVREGGWSDANPMLPSTEPTVPQGGLPVAVTAAGQDQRRSFVRLTGAGTELRLGLADAAAQSSPNAAAVRACPVTGSSWTSTQNQSFANAPAYDETACVTGVRDGPRLVFDLARYGDPTRPAGFALVPRSPAPGAPYQLVLRAR